MRKTLKVLEYTNALDLGGTAKTLQLFCKHLKASGVTVEVACHDAAGDRQKIIQDLGIRVTAVVNDYSKLKHLIESADIFHIHHSGVASEFLTEMMGDLKDASPQGTAGFPLDAHETSKPACFGCSSLS